MERGYAVEATDGSVELCKLASAYTSIGVEQMLFDELEAVKKAMMTWRSVAMMCRTRLIMSGRKGERNGQRDCNIAVQQIEGLS